MTSTEFWLAWAFNVKGLFGAAAVIALIATCISLFIWFVTSGPHNSDFDDAVHAGARKSVWVFGPILVISAIFNSVPSMDDMWRLRLGLMKLEIVNKENLEKLTDHASEVIKSLECKHLGVNCPQPEKERK